MYHRPDTPILPKSPRFVHIAEIRGEFCKKCHIDSTYINNKKYNDNFEIINNSNNDSVIIKNNNNTSANVKIMNINGVIIDEKNIKEEETFHIKNSKGVYIIQISGQDSQNHFVHKILKL